MLYSKQIHTVKRKTHWN